MTPAQAKARATAHIQKYGNSVSINGGAAILAIVDDVPESVAKSIPQDIYDSITGRPALFYFVGTQTVTVGDVIAYDGQQWSVHPTRLIEAANINQMKIVLATAGAVR